VNRDLGIYTPIGASGFELCHPVHTKDFDRIIREIDGVSRKSNWTTIEMKIVREDEGGQLKESDAPWLGSHALVFRSHAVEKLNTELLAFGELLPLECGEGGLWIYNPGPVLDALDVSRASVVRFRDGRIMMVERYAFKEDVIRGVHIFKIAGMKVSPTFVSQQFLDLWVSCGLRGLEFQKVS
jgi:hypothetical protein